jgi:hypothetical protein
MNSAGETGDNSALAKALSNCLERRIQARVERNA